ncbi:MAG: hypothetical protein K2P94_00850 [Rhodospirillaceae bacterium]|nr:hypothetical protein [Rhodospirillaceae bacterium]
MKRLMTDVHVSNSDNHTLSGAIAALLRTYGKEPRIHVCQSALIDEDRVAEFKEALASVCRTTKIDLFFLSPELSPLRHPSSVALQIGRASLVADVHNTITPCDDPNDVQIKLRDERYFYR